MKKRELHGKKSEHIKKRETLFKRQLIPVAKDPLSGPSVKFSHTRGLEELQLVFFFDCLIYNILHPI